VVFDSNLKKLIGMKAFFTSFLFVIISVISFSQDEVAQRKSPFWSTTHTIEDTYIKITYGRPHKRDRVIFGAEGLVKFNELWRTGANESTEITTTRDIKLAGNKLLAGSYSIYTIPGEKEWTIILNSELGHWGTGDYHEDKDVFRFKVPVGKTEVMYEPFTIEFTNKENGKKFDMVMMWDLTKITIPVEVF
jgi:hypothetical protein